MNNIAIERENVTKFRGAYIDENLSWKQHINDVSKKISKSIDILYKSRGIVKATITLKDVSQKWDKLLFRTLF